MTCRGGAAAAASYALCSLAAAVVCCVCAQVVVGDPDVDGFRLKVVDTCGLEDPEAGDTVNYMVSLCSCFGGRGAGLHKCLWQQPRGGGGTGSTHAVWSASWQAWKLLVCLCARTGVNT
jgi:hypothetical protein